VFVPIQVKGIAQAADVRPPRAIFLDLFVAPGCNQVHLWVEVEMMTYLSEYQGVELVFLGV
jgi:hypothetical protein